MAKENKKKKDYIVKRKYINFPNIQTQNEWFESTIGLTTESTTIPDEQLNANTSIRWYNFWGVTSASPARQNGSFWIDDVTGRIVTRDSRTGKDYGNLIYCRWAAVQSLPTATLTPIWFLSYDTTVPAMEITNPNFITITEKWYYYLEWYALFPQSTWWREIQIRNWAFPINWNIESAPAGTFVDSNSDTVFVNISRQNSIYTSWVAYLDVNDILSLHIEQNSWWNLSVTSYLSVIKL